MADWYLNADDGDDSTGDGSSGTPWETLVKAHTEASDGDTIICQDSDAAYSWVGLTFTKSLTIQGESVDASGAVFDAGGASVEFRAQSISLTFENITFYDGKGTTSKSIFAQRGTGSTWTFTNCKFIDLGITGNNTAGYSIGAGMFGDSVEDGGSCTWGLTRCLIDSPYKSGGLGNPTIFQSRQGSVTISVNESTFYISTESPNHINALCGRYVTTYIHNYTNTIISNESGQTFDTDIGSAGSTSGSFTNCDLYNVTMSGESETDNITSDPLFVAKTVGNFDLQPASPNRGAGVLI